MSNETQQLLTRWQSLHKGEGMQRAGAMAHKLRIVGIALCLFVSLGVAYSLHPALLALGALALGWVIAEHNALRTRISQWPTVQNYIDWHRVEKDMNTAPSPSE
jgi:uncharacterized membrane protein